MLRNLHTRRCLEVFEANEHTPAASDAMLTMFRQMNAWTLTPPLPFLEANQRVDNDMYCPVEAFRENYESVWRFLSRVEVMLVDG